LSFPPFAFAQDKLRRESSLFVPSGLPLPAYAWTGFAGVPVWRTFCESINIWLAVEAGDLLNNTIYFTGIAFATEKFEEPP